MKAEAVIVRDARPSDAERLSQLSLQLGYTIATGDVLERLPRYAEDPCRYIIAAEYEGIVAGWLSAEAIRIFFMEPFVEITGFIVDARYRRRGIGALLLREAENRTRALGFSVMKLKTNVIRKDAHAAYEKSGYLREKEAYIYSKRLGD